MGLGDSRSHRVSRTTTPSAAQSRSAIREYPALMPVRAPRTQAGICSLLRRSPRRIQATATATRKARPRILAMAPVVIHDAGTAAGRCLISRSLAFHLFLRSWTGPGSLTVATLGDGDQPASRARSPDVAPPRDRTPARRGRRPIGDRHRADRSVSPPPPKGGATVSDGRTPGSTPVHFVRSDGNPSDEPIAALSVRGSRPALRLRDLLRQSPSRAEPNALPGCDDRS